MNLYQLLDEKSIKIPLESGSKEAVLEELTELLCEVYPGTDRDTILECIKEREEAMKNEPIARFSRYLTDNARTGQDELDGIAAKVDAEIEEAVTAALAAPEPKPEDALVDLFVE